MGRKKSRTKPIWFWEKQTNYNEKGCKMIYYMNHTISEEDEKNKEE